MNQELLLQQVYVMLVGTVIEVRQLLDQLVKSAHVVDTVRKVPMPNLLVES